MSVSSNDTYSLEKNVGIRRTFWAWSVAIASSLSTTAAVSLPTAAVWAQEDAAAEGDESKTATTKRFDPVEFRKLLAAQKLDEASEMLAEMENGTLSPSESIQYQVMLATYQLRGDRDAALQRLQEQYDKLMHMEKLDARAAGQFLPVVHYLTTGSTDHEKNLTVIDGALEKIRSADLAQLAESLYTIKARTLLSTDRAEEAKKLYDELLSKTKESDVGSYLNHARNYFALLGEEFAEEATAVQAQATQLANELVEKEKVTARDFVTYYNFMSSAASQLTRTAPKQAAELLDQIQAKLDGVMEKVEESEVAQLKRYASNIKSLRDRLTAELERAELIGKPAADFSDVYYVAMDEVTLEDLKGKVVLLDFWAVWCGPCIATFPHLKEWHEQYSDKGLVIIGVTNFYGYAWDEEAGKAVKSKEEVKPEEELAMLAKFRESYELHHGFIVSKPGQKYSSEFKVTGIPQAVLIDKEGKIQMIRVGSGDANAHALDEKIQELLGSGS